MAVHDSGGADAPEKGQAGLGGPVKLVLVVGVGLDRSQDVHPQVHERVENGRDVPAAVKQDEDVVPLVQVDQTSVLEIEAVVEDVRGEEQRDLASQVVA